MRSLLNKRTIYVTGKGGVGKTTTAAALAKWAASENRRVLLFEINSQGRLPAIFGGPPLGHAPRELAPGIWGANINPRESMHEYALLVLKFELLYRTIFRNKLVDYFLTAVPSLAELCMTGKIWHHHQVTGEYLGTPPPDLIIVDCPASGHAYTLLHTPKVIAELTPPGPMKENAQKMWDYFSSPYDAASVFVTLPEEMPVNETLEFEKKFRDAGLPGGPVIINRVLPGYENAARWAAARRNIQQLDGAARMVESHAIRLARQQEQMDILRQRLPRHQVVEIPWINLEEEQHEAALPVATMLSARFPPDQEPFSD
ncbi:MAG: hypothetical protein GMKNLPBB_00297 [Myxococcota bacterium]|nr:hypothetical protein [Myxococcota bacterium]